MIRAILVLAALEGLAGVALAAAGTHLGGGPNLALASQMLVLHAAAVLGGAAALAGGLGSTRLGLPALALLALGAALFGGNLALRARGINLPGPLTPVGGGAMLLGWGLLAVALLVGRGGGGARGGRR